LIDFKIKIDIYLKMEEFVKNTESVKSVRSKLLDLYLENIKAISANDWKNIKKFKAYYCREFSINKMVEKIKIPHTIQVSGSEEVKEFNPLDVRRLFCYLLLGNDFTNKWKNTVDSGIGEPLFKEITTNVMELGKANDCELFTARFKVETGKDLGDYSLKLTPLLDNPHAKENGSDRGFKSFKDKKISRIPDAPKREFKSLAVKDKVQVLVETKSSNKSRAPMDSYITPETIVAMTSALEAVAEARNKSDLSRSEKATMVIKLCQLAADMIDGHDI